MTSPARDARLQILDKYPQAEVHSRGRGWLKMHDPASGKYIFKTQTGGIGWHYGQDYANEVDTAWETGDSAPYRLKMVKAEYNAYAGLNDAITFDAGQIVKYIHPATGENITFQPQELEWTNDLAQIAQIGAVQGVAASVSGDALTWVGAFGAGLDFKWRANTSKLEKLLTVQSGAAIGTPPQYIIDGGNPVLRLQFIFQRSSGVRVYVDGVLFSEANKASLTTANYIEFRSMATGATLWYFARPRAWDSVMSVSSGLLMRVRATAQNLFVEMRVPHAWLASATYPVYVDPTIDVDVGAGADDGMVGTGGEGTFTADAQCWTGNNSDVWHSWFRFTGISGLSGMTITTSYISTDWGAKYNSPACRIYANDAEAPTAPTNYAGYTGKALTAAYATWTGDYTPSPSLNSVIQELADSYNPSAIMIMPRDNSSASGAYYEYYPYDWGAVNSLYIEYTEGSASVTLDPATLTATGIPLDVVPGAKSILLDPSTLTATAIPFTVSAPESGLVVVLETG